MNMKKFVLAALAMVFSVTLFAQAPQRGERREFKPEEMATRMADGMKKELNLNDEQYKSVYNLYLKRDREARREEMKKQQEAMNAELKKVLTKEQYTKYEEMLKKQQRQRQGGPRGPQGGQGMPPRQR